MRERGCSQEGDTGPAFHVLQSHEFITVLGTTIRNKWVVPAMPSTSISLRSQSAHEESGQAYTSHTNMKATAASTVSFSGNQFFFFFKRKQKWKVRFIVPWCKYRLCSSYAPAAPEQAVTHPRWQRPLPCCARAQSQQPSCELDLGALGSPFHRQQLHL